MNSVEYNTVVGAI